MNNSDMPAMPHINQEGLATHISWLQEGGHLFATGLTKREHFAGLAMQGLVAAGFAKTNAQDMLAEWAVAYADALLAELDKDK